MDITYDVTFMLPVTRVCNNSKETPTESDLTSRTIIDLIMHS